MAEINPNRYYTLRYAAKHLGWDEGVVKRVMAFHGLTLRPVGMSPRQHHIEGATLQYVASNWEQLYRVYRESTRYYKTTNPHRIASASIARAASEVDHA